VQDRVSVVDGFADPRHARYLDEHYADAPLRDLPSFVVERLVRRWRGRRDVFFLVAQLNDRTAGFLLGQAAGAKPWRKLLADPLSLPFAAAALIQDRIRKRRRSCDTSFIGPSYPPYEEAPGSVGVDWAAFEAANVEFIFVDPAFRGRNVAAQLLASFVDRLSAAGVGTALAYIAVSNTASIRAFQKAGWSIYRDDHTLRAVRKIADG